MNGNGLEKFNEAIEFTCEAISLEDSCRRPTIRLLEVPELAQLFPNTLRGLALDDRAIGARVFIARIRDTLERVLDESQFLRIEPRLLSSSWPSADPDCLRVVYPGFGVPVYLNPSPNTQLLEALIATGEDRVYASTTSFLAAYRSELDGVEAALVVAKTLNLDLEQIVNEAVDMLDHVLAELGLERKYFTYARNEHRIDQHQDRSVDGEVQLMMVNGERVFRIVDHLDVAPVEGVLIEISGELRIGTMNFYPERLLPLVEHVPIRRLDGHIARDAE